MKYLIKKQFDYFFRHEAASGVLLIFSALIALVWANSPWSDGYNHLLHFKVSLGVGRFALSMSLLHWINDGLMAVFFLLIGMEIKRELLIGELKSLKKAALPIVAALGGMFLPAVLYLVFNLQTIYSSGWGIPMATDIAFALGMLSLLGKGKGMKGLAVFLAALAIVDDLGAIVVIAVFYTEQISSIALIAALVILALLIIANRLRVNYLSVYLILGVLMWVAVLQSGIHATIAGVLLGMTIPASKHPEKAKHTLLYKLEHAIQPWVAYGIMPIFALFNAGVNINVNQLSTIPASPLSIGIILGLFFGKQLGIFLSAWAILRLKWASLPKGVSIFQLYGVSILGGIGFTMSIFIANLVFHEKQALELAKISIICASTISAITGLLMLKLQGNKISEAHCG